MSAALVVTTIAAPTPALRALNALDDAWPLVVVGDRKTPADWALEGATYLGPQAQLDLPLTLPGLLPWNHYCRKNVGYLHAIAAGVDRLAESDDDNAPQGWHLGEQAREVTGVLAPQRRWVNPYPWFTSRRLWPRGLPLSEVLAGTGEAPGDGGRAEARPCSVQQFLAAGDPDVDAVYRLTVGEDDHEFADAPPLVLPAGAMTPWNSQSTLWFEPAFPYLYLPSHVSFRMTDIWRSFVATVCLWAHGDGVAYHPAAVRQERNAHDLRRDFADEVPGYLHNERIVEALVALELEADEAAAGENLERCYAALVELGVVPREEMALVAAWTADVAAARSGS